MTSTSLRNVNCAWAWLTDVGIMSSKYSSNVHMDKMSGKPIKCELVLQDSDIQVESCICFCSTCTQAFTVILKALLEDSRSFNGDPPH